MRAVWSRNSLADGDQLDQMLPSLWLSQRIPQRHRINGLAVDERFDDSSTSSEPGLRP